MWRDGSLQASSFRPTSLDCHQWAQAATEADARHVVLTAKHHDGFCLWPTGTTGYSVRSSPWKDGKGHVVAERAAGCDEYDLGLGGSIPRPGTDGCRRGGRSRRLRPPLRPATHRALHEVRRSVRDLVRRCRAQAASLRPTIEHGQGRTARGTRLWAVCIPSGASACLLFPGTRRGSDVSRSTTWRAGSAESRPTDGDRGDSSAPPTCGLQAGQNGLTVDSLAASGDKHQRRSRERR